jgi:hypothetical protein
MLFTKRKEIHTYIFEIVLIRIVFNSSYFWQVKAKRYRVSMEIPVICPGPYGAWADFFTLINTLHQR